MFMARRRQNVFLDTSFTQHYFFGGSVFSDLVYSINSLPDRFVFGSDFEAMDYSKMLHKISENYKKIGIEESALIKLMSQNFYKLVSKNA
jgi:predicted TIM-barrel fold metal-dependent hydrolase